MEINVSAWDFEVDLDENLFLDLDRQQSIDTKVLEKFRAHSDIVLDKKRRVTTKRKKKKLKDFNGWLLKKSGNIFRGYQKRYVYLSQDRIWYYKDPKDLTPCGIINLSLVHARVKITKNEKCTFSIIVDGWKRSFKFKAGSQEERNEWGSEVIKHM